ncbi:TPM domain-containing protein [Povalibacter sp.]|uniref:TPM domain-containing protein n=1 Tax=Povalibacter sp. TaxID=1962978 RepID=UPI002F421056
MNRRTILLMLVLVVVAGAAWQYRKAPQPSAPTPAAVVAANAVHEASPAAKRITHPRIDDRAQILDPFGPRVGRMADAFYDDLGIDLRIVTLTDTDASIEEQADQTFQKLKIGAQAPTGGLLIILNPQLRSARIEVGYTLEGALTDLHMGRIARDQLAPYVSYGSAGMAVMDVVHYLRDHVYVAAALDELTLSDDFRNRPAYLEYSKFTSGGAGARAALSLTAADIDLKRRLTQAERAQYAPSADIDESVAAFLRATKDMAGDPTLELFTEGSRLMRTYYPLARFEELQRLRRIQASMPLRTQVSGDYAVATSDKPVKGFVPILLHREKGLWRIDLVETWKNLFFNGEGNYYLRNSNTPYAPLLTQFGEGSYNNLTAYSLGKLSIEQALVKLGDQPDALSATWRAELWLRNAFVFPKAFLEYEAARKAAPNDPIVLEIYADRTMYLGFPELAIPAYEKIGRGIEWKLAQAYSDLGDTAGAQRWVSVALEENPYDLYALRWQQFLAKKDGREADMLEAAATIEMLENDPERKAQPVHLYFDPRSPKYNPESTLDVEDTKVFDHSEFGVQMRNYSSRPVDIDSIMLTSMGTAAASGLGDIKKYWKYPAGQGHLLPDETVYFKKVWGFVVDTGHQHVRYVFRVCWHGTGTTLRQCRTQWLDVEP